jgi:hypothetical protein
MVGPTEWSHHFLIGLIYVAPYCSSSILISRAIQPTPAYGVDSTARPSALRHPGPSIYNITSCRFLISE